MTDSDKYDVLEISPRFKDMVSFRESGRAKRLILKVSTAKGVEIVIPKIYPYALLIKNLLKWKNRINEQLVEIEEERGELKPNSVTFRGINEDWLVKYPIGTWRSPSLIDKKNLIISVFPKTEDILETSEILRKWLQGKAKSVLSRELMRVAADRGISYNKVTVRNQKTLWGSCTVNKNINLNQKLLFLTPEIMSYVLHHELTHLKVFNHSRDFWEELSTVYEEPRKAQKLLWRQSKTHVPLWASI